MQYIRCRFTGGMYFITINLLNRQTALLTEHIDILRQAFKTVQTRHPFEIPAIVVLPEHMHFIMTLPDGDDDYPQRIMLIKQYFSRHIPKTETINASRHRKGERGVWQRRYWEHYIRDERDLHNHIDYIHINPVKHGYVQRAAEWPHSSIHRYIKNGVLPNDWAGGDV